jgi:hypothetical protein
MTAAVHTLDFTEAPPAGREICDFCGDWHTQLRLLQFDGWTADSNTCRDCFTYPELEFTDLPIVQEAAQ